MGKETPRSLATEGAGFLEAVRGICTDNGSPKRNCLLVYYYLVCHSIELSCKAVLLKGGFSTSRLKGIGHDLSKLIVEIKRGDLGKGISEADCSIVRMMSVDYRDRRYSYALGGYRYSLVLPPWPFETAERISMYALSACKGGERNGE
ncbi:hypothetical protein [Alcanivorax xiamenensis]|uniref:hypothetical protein n=1 Tax=Alcanivorax xiamenensis TaxID=1177156 RepID=UPI00135BAF1C|nr:hypothetical protein [Alcanivorax xiamenensis]